MRHAVEAANHGTRPPSFGIVQWLNEINVSVSRDDDIDDYPAVIVRLRTKNRRWALQALVRSVNEVPCWA
jgi:hypothetical protein